MEKEIRKEIREFIIDEVNLSLARLGVNENVKETSVYDDKYENQLMYQFESAPIHQMPMMFKKVVVKGYIVAVKQSENSIYANWTRENDIVKVSVDYRYELFDRGTNGCHIGCLLFAVAKDLPEVFNDFAGEDGRSSYIRKLKGLEI